MPSRARLTPCEFGSSPAPQRGHSGGSCTRASLSLSFPLSVFSLGSLLSFWGLSGVAPRLRDSAFVCLVSSVILLGHKDLSHHADLSRHEDLTRGSCS